MPHRSLNPSRGIERLSYWWVVAALAITATTGSQAEAKPVAPGQRGGDALNRGEKASLTKISSVILWHRDLKVRPEGMSAEEHQQTLLKRGLNPESLEAEKCALYLQRKLTDGEIAGLATKGISVNRSVWIPPVPGSHPFGYYLATVRYDSLNLMVADGTYYPDQGVNQTSGDRFANFDLVDGVEIYGGFDATETTFEERAGLFDQTILTGDIGTAGDTSDNSYHVVDASFTDGSAILDGFMITAGNANGSGTYQTRGGGMFMSFGSPTIRNCLLAGNQANTNGTSSGVGGGLGARSSSAPTLTNCQFIGNSAQSGGGGMWVHFQLKEV